MQIKTEQGTEGSTTVPFERVQPPQSIEIKNRYEDRNDPTMLTVVFQGEDHTMANLLKHVITPMPGVEFVGAAETHPLEDKILLRIQTTSADYPAAEVLKTGFKTIEKVYESMEEKFTAAYTQKGLTTPARPHMELRGRHVGVAPSDTAAPTSSKKSRKPSPTKRRPSESSSPTRKQKGA